MDSSLFISHINDVKKNFKDNNEKNILKKIEQQIIEEKELIEKNKIYNTSFEKYNKFINDTKNYTKIDIKNITDEEKNHIVNFFLNVNNKACMKYPHFYHFFYCEKNTHEFIFDKINNNCVSLDVFIRENEKDLSENEIISILKSIFVQLNFLNNSFEFTHYNISLKDFLIDDEKKISLNPFNYESFKYCFFTNDNKNYGSVDKNKIKYLLTEKFIKFDRKCLMTDIYNILKEINFLVKLESFFISNSNELKNIKNIYSMNFCFNDFINNVFFDVENHCYDPSLEYIYNHDKMLDFIEYNSETVEEEAVLMCVENYFKNFNESFFLKNLVNFCEKEKENTNLEYLKINFYIFCKLKNYFYSSDIENINRLYKKYFFFMFERNIIFLT